MEETSENVRAPEDGIASGTTKSDEASARPTGSDHPTPMEDGESFPRDYVEKLRHENGKYRQRAQRSDELAQRLHLELVRATGKLADPTDLPFDEAHLEDPEALALAVDQLLEGKPHLASRRPIGEIGQGPTSTPATVDLAALMRART